MYLTYTSVLLHVYVYMFVHICLFFNHRNHRIFCQRQSNECVYIYICIHIHIYKCSYMCIFLYYVYKYSCMYIQELKKSSLERLGKECVGPYIYLYVYMCMHTHICKYSCMYIQELKKSSLEKLGKECVGPKYTLYLKSLIIQGNFICMYIYVCTYIDTYMQMFTHIHVYI
jgi:hypothetical protein